MDAFVYGASGWTGSQVVASLVARGFHVVAAGRDRQRIGAALERVRAATTIRALAPDDVESIARAAAGASVVVNCAGPSIDIGTRVLDAALLCNAHYLDVSGEATYLREVYRERDAPARARARVVAPAFAAKGGLGDWGADVAAAALGRGEIDEVAVAYAHAPQAYLRPSSGSVLSAAGQGFFRSAVDGLAAARTFEFPAPFARGQGLLVPGADDVSIPRHVRTRRVASYIALGPGEPINAAWVQIETTTRAWVPVFSRILRSRWGRWHLARVLPAPRREPVDTFAVAIEVRRGAEIVRMGISTHDAYAVTAEIVALGVERLIRAAPIRRGVLSPSEIVDPTDALRELQRRGAIGVLRHDSERTSPSAARQRR